MFYSATSSAWNIFSKSVAFSLAHVLFLASISKFCVVMFSFSTSLLSASACSNIPLFVWSYSIILSSSCWNGSNWACLDFFSYCVVFTSTYKFFISFMTLILRDMAIISCLLFKSSTATFNFSSLCSSCWILSSFYRLVQICTVLSYNSTTSFTPCAMLYTCATTSFSLFSLTSRGVLGVSFSIKSFISCLYFSIICAIFYIFSSAMTSSAYAQFGILLYTYASLFSNFSSHYFSSSFYSLIWSQVTYKISLTSQSSARLVASALALD